jgi:putative ABC transport system permease protein
MVRRHSLRNIVSLSLRDYGHEWRMSSCFVIALAAVLAPLMVLFGLKFGIVNSMLEQLVDNPRNREIRSAGSGHFEPAWFEAMRRRDDVGFVIPRTRNLAATIKLTSDQSHRIIPGELVPTGEGDPLLQNGQRFPRGYREVVLSEEAADKLEVGIGDVVRGSITRQFRGSRERAELALQVVDIVPEAMFPRVGAFVSLDLLVAAENYRDGRAVAALGLTGDEPHVGDRAYPGYRLYAASIYNVTTLEQDLGAQGLEVRTNAADIDTVLSMDRNLSTVFWIIAIVGLFGFSLSLGASLWANVDRKRRELSVLRLVGFKSGSIVAFPALQALFTGVLGWSVAVILYLLTEQAINRLLSPHLAVGQRVCYLLPEHFVAALVITLGAALVAAMLGGVRAARIEPSEGLRDV